MFHMLGRTEALNCLKLGYSVCEKSKSLSLVVLTPSALTKAHRVCVHGLTAFGTLNWSCNRLGI